jgi:hypothetical protein
MITPTANESGEQSRRRTLGGAGKTLRVYTFSGGGFDTAMQLGVVHALLVAEYDRPDLVTGVSAGAISAVALADILQAGCGNDPETKHAAQVARFRQVLEAYREGPFQLLMAQLPDTSETNARQATQNLQLPIHLEAEREGRKRAERSESGLIRLLNELLAIDLPVRQAVLLIRIALGMREAREDSRRRLLLYEFWLFYWRLLSNLHHLSLVIGGIVMPLVSPWDDPPSSCSARRALFRKERMTRFWRDAYKRLVGAAAIILLPLLSVVAFMGSKIRAKLSAREKARWKSILTRIVPEKWWKHFFSSRAGEECLKSVLSHYALAEELGDDSTLRLLFVDLFDPDYFGVLNMLQVGEAALKREKDASKPSWRHPRTLEDFAQKGEDAITVAVLAADIDKFKLRPVPDNTAVIDALMAATAIVPIFRAVGLPAFKEKDDDDNDLPPPPGTTFYIDGENVNADPLRPTIKLLQRRIHLDTSAVRFYSCVAFPISQLELPSARQQYRGLVQVATRSLQLQRLQNALLERNFIKLYHDVLSVAFEREKQNAPSPQPGVPSGNSGSPAKAVLNRTAPDGNETGEHKPLICAQVVSIEADSPLRLNEKIPGASSHEERRALIDQAVADGCRATINAWLSDRDESLHITAQQLRQSRPNRRFVSCRRLITAHLRRTRPDHNLPIRPESSISKGPGLAEVCSACRFFQERTTPDGKTLPKLRGFALDASSAPIRTPAAPPQSKAGRFETEFKSIQPLGILNTEPTVSLLFMWGRFPGCLPDWRGECAYGAGAPAKYRGGCLRRFHHCRIGSGDLPR